MQRWIVLAALAAVATPAAAAERRFMVTDYDRVQLDGPFEVTLATGGSSGAVARGSVRALDRVTIEVQGRLLKIRTNSSAWGGNPDEDVGPVSIALSTHQLRGASVRGSGSLSIDEAKAMRLDLSLSGNGRLAVDTLDADTVSLVVVGSGRVLLGGKVKNLSAGVAGSGDLEASKLVAQDADIRSGTSGVITVGVARAAKISADGSGDVEIIGTPACTVARRGGGNVSCGKPR